MAIVVSILVAFAIDASWDGFQERQTERRVLQALRDELVANRDGLAGREAFHHDVEAAILALLSEAASPSPTLPADSIDSLIGRVSRFNTSTTFEMSASDALVLGGTLSLIQDEPLRRRITSWSREVADVATNEDQDYDTFSQIWMPYLRTKSYLPQISNAITVQPGTVEPDYVSALPLGGHRMDHRTLLRDREFENVLLHRLWVQQDILNKYSEVRPRLTSLLGMVDAELSR